MLSLETGEEARKASAMAWLRTGMGRSGKASAGEQEHLATLVDAIRRRRDTLAWLFADYDLGLLQARLQCDRRAALRVQLAVRPPLERLDVELTPLALRLGISAARLTDLVREAEARRRAFPRMMLRPSAPSPA